jgi:hypothetical protein
MSHSPLFTLSLVVVLFSSAFAAAYGPVPANQAEIEELLLFPLTTSSALVSFDWDPEGTLHYTVGDPNFGLKLEVYKAAEGGDQLLFSSSDVWVGSRITRIGDHMFFNDGGDYINPDYNYYGYAATSPETIFPVLEAPFEASLWGLETRNEGEFFASGAAFSWGPAALFFGLMDNSGQLSTRPVIQFAELGDSAGPLCFDNSGTLYYAHGYAYDGTGRIFRWTAEEVAAALADPLNNSLSMEGHVWNDLPAPYDGSTGIACDDFGNVYVTATAWGSPSQLLLYNAPSSEPVTVAEYEGRLETVRYRDRSIAVSCGAGVFSVPLLRINSGTGSQLLSGVVGETVVFAVDVEGGIGERHFQWFEQSSSKTSLPVGSDASFYALSVSESDHGKSFYCEVSDASCTLQSPLFTLSVEKSVPASSWKTLVAAVFLLALSTGIILRRSFRDC